MNCIRNICLIIFFVSLGLFKLSAQTLDQLQKDKERTKEKIMLTNKLLDETKESSKVSLNKLQIINTQVQSKKKLITQIQQEIDTIKAQIATNKILTAKLTIDLDKAKAEYSKLLYNMYFRNSNFEDMMFILSAKSVSMIYRRARYLKELSNYRKSQAEILKKMQEDLDIQTDKLIRDQTKSKALFKEKEKERLELLKQKEQQNLYLSTLKKTQKDLNAQLSDYEKKAKDLNKRIEKIIAEQARKNAKRTDSQKKVDIKLSSDFSKNKGKLPWPVSTGVIVSSFGKNKVTQNIMMDNSGVDIQTDKNSIASVVFNGEVTGIFAIPGYNNTVIIRHGNYLTVYSNLTDVSVEKGASVKTGQRLGHVFTDEKDGNKTILHFELWKETMKENPATWLRK